MAVRKLARIKLTQEDIDEGRAMCYNTGLLKTDNCPVWQALRDCFTEKVYAFEVGLWNILLHYDDDAAGLSKHKHISLPQNARVFISDFDQRHSVKPFEFEIDDRSVEEFFKPEYLIERRF